MKNIAILGSTGSIGVNTLNVIRANPRRYRVVALAAGKNIRLLLRQIREHRPAAVAIGEKTLSSQLRALLKGPNRPKILVGSEGLTYLATLGEVDTVVCAISGATGLLPTYEAIKAGKHVALANKETMVMAGPLIMEEARKNRVSVLPIDSEHSAILQCLRGHARRDLKRVLLTASGGPFRHFSLKKMKKVTPGQALRHPNWVMGPKITIDSSTLMNKGLEVLEAKWLFDLHIDQIGVVIHPQSVVHSMVEYKDGSIIAQLGIPDMRIPISYALNFPRHIQNTLPGLDLLKVETLSFEQPDAKRFPSLDLAFQAAKSGGTMPAVLNGANEVAVAAFLEGKIGFLSIPDTIQRTMEAHEASLVSSIEGVMEADRWARAQARRIIEEG